MSLNLQEVCCGVCSSKHSDWYAQGQDYEYATSDDIFKMVRCKDCGNVYLNPRPTKEELSKIYPPNYYSYNYETAISPPARLAKELLDSLKVRKWLKLIKATDAKILDIGCGNGHILKILHKIGISKGNLYGVEMDVPLMKALREQGYQTFAGTIEEAAQQLSGIKFDLIILLQVLEHVEEPAIMAKVAASMLRPGGALIIETPNSDSLDVRLFEKGYWGGYHFPRHFNIFDFKTLSLLLEASGLRLVSHRYLPAHSFWIFSFHHLIDDGWKKRRLAQYFNPLQNVFLLSLFTGFDILRSLLGFKTSNIQVIALKDA